eukprot:jgi/Botrbrau1/7024/Bobra.0165s0050.1
MNSAHKVNVALLYHSQFTQLSPERLAALEAKPHLYQNASPDLSSPEHPSSGYATGSRGKLTPQCAHISQSARQIFINPRRSLASSFESNAEIPAIVETRDKAGEGSWSLHSAEDRTKSIKASEEGTPVDMLGKDCIPSNLIQSGERCITDSGFRECAFLEYAKSAHRTQQRSEHDGTSPQGSTKLPSHKRNKGSTVQWRHKRHRKGSLEDLWHQAKLKER